MRGKSKVDTFQVLQDINVTAIGDMVEAIGLFNDVNGTDYDGIITQTETVAFYPNQIKSIPVFTPSARGRTRGNRCFL